LLAVGQRAGQIVGAAFEADPLDQFTGALAAKRVLTQSPNGSQPAQRATNDLLSAFTYSSQGDLASEKYYGADTQLVGTTDDFTPPAGDPTYRIDYTNGYSMNGGRLTSRKADYMSRGAPVSVLTTLDEVYDVFTGLATTSRDSAGRSTSYQYDAFNNATQVVVSTPDGFSKTTANTYTNDSTLWYLGRLTRASVTSVAP